MLSNMSDKQIDRQRKTDRQMFSNRESYNQYFMKVIKFGYRSSYICIDLIRQIGVRYSRNNEIRSS